MEDRESRRDSVPTSRDISQRVKCGNFTYSFGSYPEGEYFQREGYDSKYIEEEGCFYYQISLSHDRLMQVFLTLLERVIPSRSHVVIKIHSGDYYRDHDTYISDELLERDHIIEWMKEFQDVALDDGFFGIGMFSETEAAEVFLDDHKTIHVYHSDPDMMEALLEQMGIPFVIDIPFFWDEPHYHEPLPLDEEHNDDYLTAFEDLADRYELFLDEEEEENTDESGRPIGITCWKVEIRGFIPVSYKNDTPKGFYSTLYTNAESRKEVTELIEDYLSAREEQVELYLQMARVPPELLVSEMRMKNPDPDEPGVWFESDRMVFDWTDPRG